MCREPALLSSRRSRWGHALHSRRQIAALLGAGLASPALARPHPPADADRRAIVAAVPPRAPRAGETLETSDDPYKRMTAPIVINGQGPFFFVVDTGANQSVISQELAAQLALPAGADVRLHGVAGAETTATAVADQFQVGRRLERAVVMPVLPQAAIGAPGILGIDRLRNQRIVLDFRSRQLVFANSDYGDLPPYTSRVRARQRSGQLTIVNADLAGIPVSAFIDSGAERTIGNPALHDLAVQRLPSAAMYDVPVVSVTGRVMQGQLAMLPVLRLGHVRLVNLTVTFADLHVFQIWGLDRPAILIGMDALTVFDSVTMDFGRSEVLFELVPRRADPALGTRIPGSPGRRDQRTRPPSP